MKNMDIPTKDWLALLAMVQSLRAALDVQNAKFSMLLDSLHQREVLDLDEVSMLQQSAKEFEQILLTDELATRRFGLLGEHLSDAFEALIDKAALETGHIVGLDCEEGGER